MTTTAARVTTTATPPLTPDTLRQRTTLSVAEASAVLGCGLRQTYAMVHDGTLPVIRVGRSFRVPAAALLRMLGLDPNAAA